jgi:outer membrane biosynthesis protein TonB
VIPAKSLKIAAITLSLTFLYWISNFAYHQVKKPAEIEKIPFIMKSPCSIKYLVNQEEEQIQDLSLYYSGIKEEKPRDLNLEKKIAEEKALEEKLLQIVSEEEKPIEVAEEKTINKKPEPKESTKNSKTEEKKQNKPIKQPDAFTRKKQPNQDKKSIFDIAEE